MEIKPFKIHAAPAMIAATDKVGDPVYFDVEAMAWGFYDETWSHFHGGYDTEEKAREALVEYCEKYL